MIGRTYGWGISTERIWVDWFGHELKLAKDGTVTFDGRIVNGPALFDAVGRFVEGVLVLQQMRKESPTARALSLLESLPQGRWLIDGAGDVGARVFLGDAVITIDCAAGGRPQNIARYITEAADAIRALATKVKAPT